jgi:hypothetical protein
VRVRSVYLSVLVGGDPNGEITPHDRDLPSYFRQCPTLAGGPATLSPTARRSRCRHRRPGNSAEVVLLRPGAVTRGVNQAQGHVGCAITGTSATAVQATAPHDGTIAPPGYLLYLVDTTGCRRPSPGLVSPEP